MRCPGCNNLNPDDAPRCGRCGRALVESPATGAASAQLRVGQSLQERYEIVALLGDGATGSVYRASDTLVGREVALKVLNPDLWTSAKARERMAREALVLGRITHPNVINIFNVFQHDDALVLELELVKGGTLSDRLAHGRLPVSEAASIMKGVLEGLGAIHAAGIVHRDLKPSNILMTDDGIPKLADLGVAHDATSKGLTGTGVTLGTVDYMSPEQVRGTKVGPASDVYACGILLHQMITGVVPFDAKSDFEVMSAHLGKAPDLMQMQTLAPPALVHAVARALAKDPAQRWNSATELGEVVAKVATKPPSAVARTLTDEVPRLSREQLAQLSALDSVSRDSYSSPTPAPPPPADRHAGTIVSSLLPDQAPRYGKCLPIAVALMAVTVVLGMIVVGAILLGIVQLGSGGGIEDLVEQSR